MLIEARWSGPVVDLARFEAFAMAFGMTVLQPDLSSPFHHEVVEVVPEPDEHAPARVLVFHWPCLMLGPMLFFRAGVRVGAGAGVLAPGIADASTLYWAAHWRKYRPHTDLSQGWGSNSQWRTRQRRDYLLDGHYRFNVDGEVDLALLPPRSVDEGDLLPAERTELLVHRCFVTTRKPSDDHFPYRDRVSLPIE